MASITYTGQSNFVVKATDANLDALDLLVNEIGSYQGTVLLPDEIVNLEINASGPWTVTIAPVTTARALDQGQIAGHGDDVILYKGSAKPAAIAHDGTSNFVVKTYGGRSPDLVVNEIGPYNGTVPLTGPSVVGINADGNWSITVG
jgi:hypothetical protein